jgi:hypothetical protein
VGPAGALDLSLTLSLEHNIYVCMCVCVCVYRGASWCSGAVARRLPTDTTRRNSISRPILHTHIPLIVSRGACVSVFLCVCVQM